MQPKLLVAALILPSAILLYWQMSKEESIEVRLTEVEGGSVEATAANTRAETIKACQHSRLSMPVGGQVTDLLIDEGDFAEKGQVLIQLWSEDQQARVGEAKAQFTAARESAKESCHKASLSYSGATCLCLDRSDSGCDPRAQCGSPRSDRGLKSRVTTLIPVKQC